VEAIGDDEGAVHVGRGVVPDDPDAAVRPLDAERAGRVVAAELRVRTGLVAGVLVGDRDVVDRLARPQRDVTVGAAERALEDVGEPLADVERRVGLDSDGDVGLRDEVGLRARGRRPEESDRREREEAAAEPAQVENCTDGASRAAPSVSK
jgi:hypothetical protein